MATIQDIFDWLNQGAQGDIPGTGGEQPNAPAASQSAQPQITPAAATPPPQQSNDQAQEIAERRRRQGYLAGQKAGQGIAHLFTGTPQQASQQPKTVTVDPDTTSNLDFSGIGNLLSQYHQIAQTAPGTNLYFDAPQTSVATPANYSGDIPAELLPHYQALVQQGIPPDVARSILLQPSTGEGESPTQAGYPLWPYAYSGEQQESAAHMAGPPRDAALDQHMQDQRFYEGMNQPTQEGQVQGPGDNFGFLRLPSGQYVPPGWGG